jgi:3-hydroxybutyryl-CoA dehydrogenase
MAITKVAVIGCGLMGSGIAEVAAKAGHATVVREIDDKALASGKARIEKSLTKAVEKGKLDASARDQILGRITYTTDLKNLADVDLVIEVIIEDAKLKKELFGALDTICKPSTIFCSNTSNISITELAAATKRHENFAGMHFFNPVPVMKLVEVIRGVRTSQATIDALCAFTKAAGKEPIVVKDTCGFVVNVLLVPYLFDAIRLVENGVASIEDIDKGMKLGCGYPMGPLELLDFVGIDTTYHISVNMFDEFKSDRYAAPPLLKKMHLAGLHGRKSGKGFYDYTDPAKPVPMKLS